MAVRSRIDSIDRDVALILAEDLSADGQARQFAAAARAARDEALRQNTAILGRRPRFTTMVNGRTGADEASVTLPGSIAYEFDLATDMLAVIGDLLVRNSPSLTGRYAQSFIVFVDGAPLAEGQPLPEGAEEVVFVNTQPYARKIERGQSDQTPEGVFAGVAAIARSRFGNVASVKFSYRSLQESGLVDYAGVAMRGPVVRGGSGRGGRGRFAAGSGRRTGSSSEIAAVLRERETRTPAIIIRFR